MASGAKQSAGDLGAGDPAEKLGSASEAVNDAAGAARHTVRGELGSIAREAAIEVLGPVVKNATTEAAKYAVRKGPQLAVKRVAPKLMDTVGPAIEEAGGPAALARGALSAVSVGGEGLLSRVRLGRGDGHKDGDERESAGIGRGRRVPVEASVDIGAPIEVVYDTFTQFEDFTKFIFRAEDIEQTDDTHLVWTEKIWGIRRKLEVEITDLESNARIAWKSETGTESTGAITFHRLDERLTRVLVTQDVQPHGLLERSASGFRLSRRSLKSDLIRFKALIELREDEEGAAAGRAEDGVVHDAENQPTRSTKASKPTRATSKRAKPAGAGLVEEGEVVDGEGVEDGEVVDGGENQPTRSTKASKSTRATSKRAKPARRRRRAPEPEPEPDDEYEDVDADEEEDEPEAFEDEQDEVFEDDEPEAFEDEEDEEEEPREPVRRRPIRRRAPARPSRGR